MKLLCVIDSLNSGGAQRQLVTLATGLKKRGHSVELFIYHPQYTFFRGELDQNGIRIHAVKKKRRFAVNGIISLRKTIINGNYDAVVSFLTVPNFYLEIASIGLKKIPIVISLRGWSTELPSITYNLLQQFHRLADKIITNSYAQKDVMIRNFPWMISKIETIYNGVDLKKFFIPTNNMVPESTGVARFLVIGSAHPGKNAINLIKALAEYRRLYGIVPTIHWAGKYGHTNECKIHFEEVNHLLESYGLQDNWCWLGVCEDIPKLMQRYNALLHPSLFEGLPNAICEALSAGLPVLASRVGDHSRLISEEKSGFLFDPKDPKEIAKKIFQFSSLNSKTVQKMGETGRGFAQKYLSVDKLITSYENMLEKIVAQRVS